MVERTIAHPSWEALLAYGQGRLDPPSAQTLEEHLADCLRCCELLETAPGDSFVSRLRDADANEPLVLDRPIPPELIDHPRYRVLGRIGQGGMGTVYRAIHRRMERRVALKVIRSSLLRHAAAVERFQQEAKTAARLHHPHIVTAYDADQAGELHFLVMEYVEGCNLADYLQEKGPLPVAEACAFVRQAALGLHHAHEQGTVHRDIKPHNLMLQREGATSRGIVKILDFGLARLPRTVEEPSSSAGLASNSLTATGVVMGTADYIAPEQAADPRNADIRADIYALGCTLFHLLTGRPPFLEGTVAEKLARHADTPLPSLTALRREAPLELAAVLERMTAKNPHQRYTTPAETAEALAPFCPTPSKRPRRTRKWPWLAAVLVLSAAGMVAGTLLWHHAGDHPPRDDHNAPGIGEPQQADIPTPAGPVLIPSPAPNPDPVIVPEPDSDPAEETAIALIQKHGGWVKQDSMQPNNPVVEVNVWMPSFTDNELKALASLTKVRKMTFANTKITGVGFKDLTGMKDLTDLTVSQTPVTDEGLKAIAGLTQLKILAMRGTKVTDPGLRPLTALTQLEELAVANNFDRGDTGAVFIATNLKQLKRLYIDNSAIGDAGVIELAKMPNLQLLTINGTRVTDKAVEALPELKSLEELHLSHFPTDKTAAILARCENLRVLHLFDAQITDKGLKTLGKLPHLKTLDLTFCRNINSQAITDFIKAHPNCSVKK